MNSVILYNKENEIILCEKSDKELSAVDQNEFIYDCDNQQDIKQILNEAYNSSAKIIIYLMSEDLNALYSKVKSHYTYVEAAGGIVRNEKKQLLVIHRFGVPDLPKGKIEKGEVPTEAALREVEEECGISDLRIVKESEASFHMYKIREKQYLKKTFWFEMIYEGTEKPTPQTEESITEVEWCKQKKINAYKDKTYKSLRKYFS